MRKYVYKLIRLYSFQRGSGETCGTCSMVDEEAIIANDYFLALGIVL